MPDRPCEKTSENGQAGAIGPPGDRAVAGPERGPTGARAMPLVQTFELYLTGRDGVRRFEPLTCQPLEIVTRVRPRLIDADAVSAEVWQAGQRLFILAGASEDP